MENRLGRQFNCLGSFTLMVRLQICRPKGKTTALDNLECIMRKHVFMVLLSELFSPIEILFLDHHFNPISVMSSQSWIVNAISFSFSRPKINYLVCFMPTMRIST